MGIVPTLAIRVSLQASGKILPRLPEGTRCGNLVMGKYGLYDPEQRKQQEKEYVSLSILMKKILVISLLIFFKFNVGCRNLKHFLIGVPVHHHSNSRAPPRVGANIVSGLNPP